MVRHGIAQHPSRLPARAALPGNLRGILVHAEGAHNLLARSATQRRTVVAPARDVSRARARWAVGSVGFARCDAGPLLYRGCWARADTLRGDAGPAAWV